MCILFCAGCTDDYGHSVAYERNHTSITVIQPAPGSLFQELPCKIAGTCMEGNTSLQTVDENQDTLQEYATDLRLTAGCEVDPPEMAVAKAHIEAPLCERILATPMMNQDGDFFEVAAKFAWIVSDNEVLQLHCLNGFNSNLCWPLASQDIFDNPLGVEPTSLVMACAFNTCPEAHPKDCKHTICASVTVKVVVNVEGSWTFMGATFDPETSVMLSQSGRTFEDIAIGIENGLVDGRSASFEYRDYAYTGTVSEGGETMAGYVTDLVTSNFVGTWWAIR
ncbi:hypothetical protein KKD88_02080 [Patescibacteria group bacterium]|nr:hypothetical protein [Patescibacteria group bacterium]MBU1629843.1 hypothetical protein [Patescibacteria group bacterium]